jgi:hypothetical protein
MICVENTNDTNARVYFRLTTFDVSTGRILRARALSSMVRWRLWARTHCHVFPSVQIKARSPQSDVRESLL